MPLASTIRLQVESALARKIPSALTPAPRLIRPQMPTGLTELDELSGGGFPLGALTELVGAECSGRTSVALSFLAQLTEANKVCAWVDSANAFDPASAAAIGVDLGRLLWVRCADVADVSTKTAKAVTLPPKYFIPGSPKKGLHGGGFGPHPRTEIRGLSEAMAGLFTGEAPLTKPEEASEAKTNRSASGESVAANPITYRKRRARHYDAIERTLRTTDLLLQTGGFSAIVLDLAGIAPQYVARIELSTWHRYRVAAEKTQACILLLTQYPCAKSGSELQLRLLDAEPILEARTVFSGMRPRIEVLRQRFPQPANNVVSMRKPPQTARIASWQSRTPWAGAQ